MTATLTRKQTRVNAVRGLLPSEWTAYFEQIDDGQQRVVSIESTGRAGSTAVERVDLQQIRFDENADRIAIGSRNKDESSTEERWHYVDHPRMVHVASHDDDPVTLTIVTREGRTVVRFLDVDAE
jgi:hypothetical protein